MIKPKIRIFHNLGRSGGTLICKCLGCMKHVVLLSEIHPLGTNYYHPLAQAYYWHNIQVPPQGKQFTFVEGIRFIEKNCATLSRNLVIRDWAYLDFIGKPINQNPSYRMRLVETLSNDCDLIRFGVVRHPIDMWLSLIRCQKIEGLSLSIFIHGYFEYAKQMCSIGFIKFEDFTKNPTECMQIICKKLELSYDGDFITQFFNYKKITGDAPNSRGGSLKTIVPLPRFPIDKDLLYEFQRHDEYGKSLQLLNYDDVLN